MASLNVAEHIVPLLPNGRLKHLSDWTPEVAEALAHREHLTLGDAHWEIIRIMREHYDEYHVSPIRKLLLKEVRRKLGTDKANNSYLDRLFPGGVMAQGTRIAGVPTAQLDAELDRDSQDGESVARADGDHPAIADGFEFHGRVIRLTPAGNLRDLHEWDEDLGEYLAEREGLQLTRDHWALIRYLRKFYFEYGIAPMVKLLMRHMAEELGPEQGRREYLYRLFPGGPARQGSRIAGLPEPQGCIDG